MKYPNWNLNTFKGGSILTGKKFPGINTPFLNYGMYATYFGMHVEDSNTISLNTLHEGAPKTWYGIPASMATNLENLSRSEIFEKTGCNLFLKHKALLYNPNLLRKNGIDFCKVSSDKFQIIWCENQLIQIFSFHEKTDQFEGETIVTLYQAHHQGFNHGFNCSEAINYATPEWKTYYEKTALCSCV